MDQPGDKLTQDCHVYLWRPELEENIEVLGAGAEDVEYKQANNKRLGKPIHLQVNQGNLKQDLLD